jgi:hypothetical protein
MLKIKPLGILYKNNKIVNHRSLLKILLNPILRVFGFCLGSLFDCNNEFIQYKLDKQKKNLNLISLKIIILVYLLVMIGI